MTGIIVYPILTAALWYLSSRARITSFLWSRYPKWLASFIDCPACFPCWIGAGVAAFFGLYLDVHFLTLDPHSPITIITMGLIAIITTPPIAALQQYSIEWLGTAIAAQETDAQ